jgi:hypothetical protein
LAQCDDHRAECTDIFDVRHEPRHRLEAVLEVLPESRSPNGRLAEVGVHTEAQGWHRVVVRLAAVLVVVMFGSLIGVRLVLHIKDVSPPDAPNAPADVVAAVTHVHAEQFEAVGQGDMRSLPIPVRARLALDPTGRVLITYIGAEWCAQCAAERWPLIVALSRFGQFSNLRATASAADGAYPSIPTFSFYGAEYASGLLDFASVELQSNERESGQFRHLQLPTEAEQQVMRTYDAPPYVASASTAALPFIDIANRYVISGATFNPGLLTGGSSQSIAFSLASASSAQARAVIGSANILTAALCEATGDRPSTVCEQATVRRLEDALAQKEAPSST